MLRPAYTIQFQKDLKIIKKRGKKIETLKSIIIQLVNQKPLDERYRDHKLIGSYKGFQIVSQLSQQRPPNFLKGFK